MTTASAHSPPPSHATSSPKYSSTSQPALQRASTTSRPAPLVGAGAANGSSPTMARPDLNGSIPSGYANGETSRFRPAPNGSPDDDAGSNDDGDRRPTSAPGQRNGNVSLETRDDIGPHRPRRPTKPLLQRSKSEFGPRPVEEPEPVEEQIPEWGAKHGFEDHYQSEHIISQLANVSRTSAPILASLSGHSLRSRCLQCFRWR